MFSKSFVNAAASLSLLTATASAYAIHEVFVGGVGQLKFFPEHISAHPGDRVRFTFGAKNHTVTQSSFDTPCSALTDAHGMHNGFFSGYMPVPADQTEGLPQFWIDVNDEKPIWAFCQQGNHCQQGMVFAVNAPADPSPKSFANWKALAMGGAPPPPAAPSPVHPDPYASPDPYGSAPDPYATHPQSTPAAAPTTTTPTTAAPAATTPPADGQYPSVITVTQTVTVGSNVWTTVYGSYPGSADPTPAPLPVVHNVVVGGTDGLVFKPSSIQAKPNDIVQFEFRAKNHTVTESTFQTPCVKKQNGFDSGFVPTAADATVFTSWNFTVVDTQPVWAYCAQGNHCTSGMVFSINAVEASEINQGSFENKAKALAQNAPAPSGSASSAPSAASPKQTTTNGALGRFESTTAVLSGSAIVAGIMMLL